MPLEDFLEDFYTTDYEAISDGMGGLMRKYIDKDKFRAGCSTDSSTEAEIAYRTGTKTIFHITLLEGMTLSQGDVVRRVKDNRKYRITSNSGDRQTPDVAQVRQSYVTAEVIQ